jgi:hypothetical protein
MQINFITLLFFVLCKNIIAGTCGDNTEVLSTVTGHDITNSLCDVCLKYRFNGNSHESNSDLSISCTLPGKLSCYETNIVSQYEIDNSYVNCSVQTQTIFGDESSTIEYLNDEYPIGGSLELCVKDDSCYFPTSSASNVKIVTSLYVLIILSAVINL